LYHRLYIIESFVVELDSLSDFIAFTNDFELDLWIFFLFKFIVFYIIQERRELILFLHYSREERINIVFILFRRGENECCIT